MKQPTWLPAFAAGALFAGAIGMALVVTQPGSGAVTLDRAATPSETAAAGTGGSDIVPAPAPEVDATEASTPEVAAATTVPVPLMAIEGDAATAHSVEDGCQTKGAEWQRREDAGEIDWDELSYDTFADDPDSVWLDPTPFDGGVWAPSDRLTMPDFSKGLDVGTLSNGDLLFAVEVCDEAGMFPEG